MLKTKQQFIILICGIFFLFVGAILPVTAFAQDYEDSPSGYNYAKKLKEYSADLGETKQFIKILLLVNQANY